MIPSIDNTGAEDQEKDKERSIMVYCRLFSDFVPMHICTLRKRELNPFGWNTCNGCVIGLLQNWIVPASKGQDQQLL
jgi:hypothetical protein